MCVLKWTQHIKHSCNGCCGLLSLRRRQWGKTVFNGGLVASGQQPIHIIGSVFNIDLAFQTGAEAPACLISVMFFRCLLKGTLAGYTLNMKTEFKFLIVHVFFFSYHRKHGRVQTRPLYWGSPARTHAVATQEDQGKKADFHLDIFLHSYHSSLLPRRDCV